MIHVADRQYSTVASTTFISLTDIINIDIANSLDNGTYNTVSYHIKNAFFAIIEPIIS